MILGFLFIFISLCLFFMSIKKNFGKLFRKDSTKTQRIIFLSSGYLTSLLSIFFISQFYGTAIGLVMYFGMATLAAWIVTGIFSCLKR